MEKLAIFDVDFTLTRKETLLEFYKFMLKKHPKFLIYIPRTVFSGLFYVLKFHDEKKTKEIFTRFIRGIREEDMEDIVKEFYEKVLCRIIYKDSIDMIAKLKKEGCKVILISASPEFYLKSLYNIKEVDKIIGTRISKKDGIYQNKLEGENCKGEEKVRRLKSYIKEKNIDVDFKNSYMFSDSLADLPLFKLVGKPYLINYNKKYDDIEILNWK
ncbi:HAD-IB family hydrolase [Hathewaya histolytica]|uniref:HAD superfamily hydrolase n=1 Tax=Hathewaya histolytica TaxID=1498 RepID=A0A4U9R859_HATHI|nr:HAD-IB family hydrolase [Hathewaya histolytica]VTQ87489.1 HAD superfamily hydrolase [Hathewaya histolytica]